MFGNRCRACGYRRYRSWCWPGYCSRTCGSLYRQGEDTAGQRRAILVEQRDQMVARMEEMQRSLDRLNRKIAAYDNGSWRGEPSQGSCGQCGSKP